MSVTAINACTSADALEQLVGELSRHPIPQISTGKNAFDIAGALEAKSNDSSLGCNAKLRRKVKRLISSLQDGTFGIAHYKTSGDAPVAASIGSPRLSVDASVDPAGAVGAAATFFDLKETMDSIVVPAEENISGRRALKQALEVKLKNPPFAINKTLRRRMDRLIFSLCDQSERNTVKREKPPSAVASPTLPHVSSIAKNASFVEPTLKPAVGAAEVEAWCSEVHSAISLVELEKALGSISPEQVTATSQKILLVRCLMKASCGEGVTLNAKARRRIARLIDALGGEAIVAHECEEANPAPIIYSTASESNRDNKFCAGSRSDSQLLSEGSREDDPTSRGPNIKSLASTAIPYVVFVGQLDYKVQDVDIIRHFRSGGVEGDLKVRMTTDRDTGKFKGTAFVELEGPREMHKAIGLHHTLLNGRRINVEKSCGGRNKDLRTMRIKEQRTTQKIHSSDAVDAVLKTFESTGLISTREIPDNIMNRLYACTPSEVQTMFDQFNRESSVRDGPGKKGDLREFYKILCAHDKGGYQVDQSKMRGYGNFSKRTRRDSFEDNTEDDEGIPAGSIDCKSTSAEWVTPPAKIFRRDGNQSESSMLEDQGVHHFGGNIPGSNIFRRFPSMRGRGGKFLR
jgi:RNA recognition motif-containing protein